MATLQYTVFRAADVTGRGPVLNENVIAIGGASVQSAIMDPNAPVEAKNGQRAVRIVADAKCYVTWGQNPTALGDGTQGRMMGPDISTGEYFDIKADEKIAVIARA